MQLAQARRARERPRERVLSASGSDQKDAHGASRVYRLERDTWTGSVPGTRGSAATPAPLGRARAPSRNPPAGRGHGRRPSRSRPSPAALASLRIRLRARRVETTRPDASKPAFSNADTASRTSSRCSSHSRLLGISPGFGKPRPVPQTRAIDITKMVACSGRASSQRLHDHLVADLPPLGGDHQLAHLELGGIGWRRASQHRPHPNPYGQSPAVTGAAPPGLALVLRILHLHPPPVDGQVGDEDHPADEEVDLGVVASQQGVRQ